MDDGKSTRMMDEKIITSDDILGKEAVDPEGQILGVVMKLHIDKQSKKLVGLTIDQGFMKPEMFIGLNYIKNFGIDSVFLNKVPLDKFKGMDVITSEGKLVGKVRKVNAEMQKVKELVVGKGIKKFLIPASSIDKMGVSVILKKSYRSTESK